jgi:PAS domain S-box-containing protein
MEAPDLPAAMAGPRSGPRRLPGRVRVPLAALAATAGLALSLASPTAAVSALLLCVTALSIARLEAWFRATGAQQRPVGTDLAADVALAASAFGGGLFLVAAGGDTSALAVGVFAVLAGAAGACSALLAVARPTGWNLGLLASAGALGVAAAVLSRDPAEATAATTLAGVAAVVILAVGLFEPPAQHLVADDVVDEHGSDRFALFSGACLVGAVELLLLAPIDQPAPGAGRAIAMAAAAVAVGGRFLVTQAWARRTRAGLGLQLQERERAIELLEAAAERIGVSEARLRLLFDSAVDGVVEMDEADTIVRANGAFCSMVGIPSERILGRVWADVAEEAVGGGRSLRDLPLTGEAVLISGDDTRHLEARRSRLATVSPGSLLVIRDVTAGRRAEQTIRTLLKYLQDRDEDRTQLLQRTNAAIEAERNRIARDLHDGPIQGVSGATLSLEAVRLMIESGDAQGAAEMLKNVKEELAEEADSLRRVMGDLRPPVLEERGLVPALRELCQRFERERGTLVWMTEGPYVQVPPDLETLAYRVVQEALSNVAKHGQANQVNVLVETGHGILKVEVADDGVGFDPSDVREFLRTGKVGLASMRERTELGGGMLTVRSRRGVGTTVAASIPFEILATAPGAP